MAYFNAGSGSYQIIAQATLNPTLIPAFSTSVETFTPAPLAAIDNTSQVRVEAPSIETGVRILTSRMTSTVGTLEITFQNFTNATVDPASQTFNLLVF